MPFSRLLPRTQKANTVGFSALAVLVALLAVVGFQIFHAAKVPAINHINYTQLRELAETGAGATAVKIEGEMVSVVAADGALSQAVVANTEAQQEIASAFARNKVPVEYQSLRPGLMATVFSYSLPVITLLFLGFIGWRVYSSMGQGGDYQPEQSSDAEPVTFADVAGVDEARSELAETIDFLRDPLRFGRLGGRPPRGILL